MQNVISTAWQFKWRVATYFGTAFFGSLGGAFSTSGSATTWQQWVVAFFIALGVGFSQIKALMDQNIDPTTATIQPPTDNTTTLKP